MDRLDEVLSFWFGSATDDADVAAEKGSLWFGKSAATDRDIDVRFADLVRQAADGSFESQLHSGHDRLALIILLDQFTRNIYRGQPECFASDPLALQLALEGLKVGDDQQLRPIERVFFYLPLEHAEDEALQHRSVTLFAELMDTVPQGWRKTFAGFHDYAVRHRDIIVRFGRFPHRNSILGRSSTAEEREFLTQPGSSF
ncbi:MAG: DUF924 domain-containing protein [Desulfuromonas sp.]|jgi:uncharacterized protein (DUF924 family)|nr:MAG: DUF924 domain-containing protein [Desulfuromonas sp.]